MKNRMQLCAKCVVTALIVGIVLCFAFAVCAAQQQQQNQERKPVVMIKPAATDVLKPDLSCYFEQQLNKGMRLWVQNNTPQNVTQLFRVHYEAVKDGVKVLDSYFEVAQMSGNYKNYFDLIPCAPGQKFTATVDSGEYGTHVAETDETNNTCTYNCGGPFHMNNPKNINPAFPRAR